MILLSAKLDKTKSNYGFLSTGFNKKNLKHPYHRLNERGKMHPK
jgi:hypothetical protein